MSTRVTLTPLGRGVLAGKADRVEVAPLDRWFGGMRIDGACRWDSATRRLRPPGRSSG
jgi:hypothetical protein